MAKATLELAAPKGFRLRGVVYSHGWMDLPPFAWNEAAGELTGAAVVDGVPVAYVLREAEVNALATVVSATLQAERLPAALKKAMTSVFSRMLGFGVALDGFHRIGGKPWLWAKRRGVGRFLRAPTVYEDAVKMLATTNCSWSLTKVMVNRLVDSLGEVTPAGVKAFPTSAAMAAQSEAFYRDEIKAGYRARYFRELAEKVAGGTLQIESWADFPGDTPLLVKEIRAVQGFGPYVAENLCRLLGRFEGLGIDSWCRARFVKLFGEVEGPVDAAIIARYEPYGEWRGLAMWLELTREWHETGKFGDTKFETK